MQVGYTHLSVILDRTGSMESIRDDVIGGFNAFVRDQKGQPGKATLTLVQFDSQDPYEVLYRFRPVQSVPELTRNTYVPRASTPLLDAIGRGINDLETCIAEIGEGERPSKVVFVIITDGQENASLEFNKGQIVKMIKDKTDNHGWQFLFLSADLDAVGDAVSYGTRADATLLFRKDARGTAEAWNALSCSVSDYRTAEKKKIGFDPGDRQQAPGPKKKGDKRK